MTEERLVDVILGLPKPAEPEQARRRNIFRRQAPTLHRRDVSHLDFYVVARFIHALMTVKAAVAVVNGTGSPVRTRLPLVADLGRQELNLPVWRKVGNDWQAAGYQLFEKEALALAVPMMHCIVRYLGVKESAIIGALYNLSMIAVAISAHSDGQRYFRQRFRGRLINPRDGQPVNVQPETIVGVETMSAFILDKSRVNEWIRKELQKRER